MKLLKVAYSNDYSESIGLENLYLTWRFLLGCEWYKKN